jgi:hypothetical protein
MTSHRPTITRGQAARTMQSATDQALDAYKHGEISESEALILFDQGVALYVQAAREAFLLRMRNLEAFRTPRGEQLPATGGR